MLFPTIEFVIFFAIVMPISWLLLPMGVKRTDWRHRIAWKIFILIASYIFLGYNQPRVHIGSIALPFPCVVLFCSIVTNFVMVELMQRQTNEKKKKIVLTTAIIANVAGLAYFKYRNFIIIQANDIFQGSIGFPQLSSLIIPIAISFFTFQAISYVVDVYRGTVEKISIFDLAVYLSFFPHLVAGPIVRANEFVPQMRNPHNPRAVEATRAATLIARGLFKKMIIADLLYTQLVRPAFASPSKLSSLDAIAAVYGYSAQLYCDFSGYTDIAIGIALLLGFKFPENFNRPYIASSLRDFWQRWHMTLSRWLKDYVYIPMGGNRTSIFGPKFIAFNLIATMTIGGLWHGANTTFVFWGLYMGILLVVEKFLREFNAKHDINIPIWIRRFITFNVVTFGWIIFASESMANVQIMLGRIFSDFSAPPVHLTIALVLLICCGIFIQYLPPEKTSAVTTYISRQPIVTQAAIFGTGLLILSTFSATISAFVYGFF